MAPIVLPSPGATAAVVCEERDVEGAVGSSGRKQGRGCEPEEALRVLKSSLPRGGGPALVLWTRGYHCFGVAQSLYPKLGFRALGGAVLPPGWSVKGTEGGLAFDQGGADEQATTRGVVVVGHDPTGRIGLAVLDVFAEEDARLRILCLGSTKQCSPCRQNRRFRLLSIDLETADALVVCEDGFRILRLPSGVVRPEKATPPATLAHETNQAAFASRGAIVLGTQRAEAVLVVGSRIAWRCQFTKPGLGWRLLGAWPTPGGRDRVALALEVDGGDLACARISALGGVVEWRKMGGGAEVAAGTASAHEKIVFALGGGGGAVRWDPEGGEGAEWEAEDELSATARLRMDREREGLLQLEAAQSSMRSAIARSAADLRAWSLACNAGGGRAPPQVLDSLRASLEGRYDGDALVVRARIYLEEDGGRAGAAAADVHAIAIAALPSRGPGAETRSPRCGETRVLSGLGRAVELFVRLEAGPLVSSQEAGGWGDAARTASVRVFLMGYVCPNGRSTIAEKVEEHRPTFTQSCGHAADPTGGGIEGAAPFAVLLGTLDASKLAAGGGSGAHLSMGLVGEGGERVEARGCTVAEVKMAAIRAAASPDPSADDALDSFSNAAHRLDHLVRLGRAGGNAEDMETAKREADEAFGRCVW